MSIENVTIKYTNDERTEALISMNVIQMGDFYSAGRTKNIIFNVKDTPQLRGLASFLFDAMTKKRDMIFKLTIGDKDFNLDCSLWHGLAASLNAFVFACEFDNGLKDLL